MRGAYLLTIPGAACRARCGHDAEDLRARVFRALDRFGHDLVADTRQVSDRAGTGDAVLGAAKFEVHVAEMIFGADDVGEQLVALQVVAARRSRSRGRRRCRRPAS